MQGETDIRAELKDLLASQPLAVLATQDRGQPYTSLVAFAVGEDWTRLFFATTRTSRKYANLSHNPAVALLVDNRSNRVADFRDAVAVTAVGTAAETTLAERDRYLPGYLTKHPNLKTFATSPTTAFLKIDVSRYIVVRRFQNVMELTVAP